MDQIEPPKAAKTVCFSKKKYNDFKHYLDQKLGSEMSIECCEKLCEIFTYDPEANTSDPEKSKKNDLWRKNKAKELGVSLYRINMGIKNLNLNNQSTVQE